MFHAKGRYCAAELWSALSRRYMDQQARRGPERQKLRASSLGYVHVIRRISPIYLFLLPRLSTACFTPSPFSDECLSPYAAGNGIFLAVTSSARTLAEEC